MYLGSEYLGHKTNLFKELNPVTSEEEGFLTKGWQLLGLRHSHGELMTKTSVYSCCNYSGSNAA